MPRLFISSTSELSEHRKKLANWITKRGGDWSAEFQDHGIGKPETPFETSLRMVHSADLIIVLVGRLYGSTPKGKQNSFCELEYDEAKRLGKPCLAFVIDEHEHHCPPKHFELVGTNPEQFSRQKIFRQRICSDLNVGDEFFKSADNLVAIAVRAVEDHFSSDPSPNKDDAANGINRFFVPKPPTFFAPYPYSLQSGRFVGRADELNALSAWIDKSDDAVLALTALGGAGKSALAWNWFQEHVPNLQTEFEGTFWWSFYDDSSYERCVALLLAYVTQADLEQVLERSFDLNLRDLLSHLNARRFLVCLDGVERVLRGYRELDIDQGASDLSASDSQINYADFDAEYVGDNAVSMGRSEYRQGVGKVGKFLSHLPTLMSARVLCSTRLFPADFELEGLVRDGVTTSENLDFSDEDALELLEAHQVHGARKTLLTLSNAVGNHPLTLRILSGEVAKNTMANGDIDVWLSRNPNFDPFGLAIRQRRRHVLLFALRGLRARSLATLGAIAAFRGPAPSADLEKILVSDGGFLSNSSDLENAIEDLRDRHLIGWESEHGEFDMHPIVRGVSWKNFDRKAQERLATLHGDHFENVSASTKMSASARLYALRQRFFSLIERRRYVEAYGLIDRKVSEDAVRNGKNYECVDMLEACLEDGRLDKLLINGTDNQIEFLRDLSFHYSHCGQSFEAFKAKSEFIALLHNHTERKSRKLEKMDLYNFIKSLIQNGYISQAQVLVGLNRSSWEKDRVMSRVCGQLYVMNGKNEVGLEILFNNVINGFETDMPSWGVNRIEACEIIVDGCLKYQSPQYDLHFALKIANLALHIARKLKLTNEIPKAETMVDQVHAYLPILPEHAIRRVEKRLERARHRNHLKTEYDITLRLLAIYARFGKFARGETIAQDCIALSKLINDRSRKLKLSLALSQYYSDASVGASALVWARNAQALALQPDGSVGVTSAWREATTIAERYKGHKDVAGPFREEPTTFPEHEIDKLISMVLSLTGSRGEKVTD